MSNAAQRVADVITMPARSAGSQATSAAAEAARHVYDWTANDVDD